MAGGEIERLKRFLMEKLLNRRDRSKMLVDEIEDFF
jgi:hypothetical protein